MVYNTTQLANAANPFELFQVVNTWSVGLLSGGFLFVVFFVQLYLFKNWNLEEGILASSFTTLLLSVLLRNAGLVSLKLVLLFGIILALTGVFMLFRQQ